MTRALVFRANRTRLTGSYFFIELTMNPILIFGAGPLGKLALDIAQSNALVVYGFLDDTKELIGKEIGEIPVLGHTEDDGFLKLIGQKCDALVAAESTKERSYLSDMLVSRRHVKPVNAIHAQASLSPYASLGYGNVAAAGCRISAFSSIGDGCVLYPNSILETGVLLSDHVMVGSGSVIGAEAEISEGAFIGPGVTILGGIKIGKNASIGAGSVVLADVPAGAKMFGYPAQKIQ